MLRTRRRPPGGYSYYRVPRAAPHTALWRFGPGLLATAVVLGLSSLPAGTVGSAPPGLDKVVHAILYMGVAFAYLNAATAGFQHFTVRSATLALAALAGLALLDERYQALIPGRHPDGWDIAADLAGGALAFVLSWLWVSRRRAVAS